MYLCAAAGVVVGWVVHARLVEHRRGDDQE